MSCRSKDDADAVGVEGLRRVCESVDIPVVSIGGVNAQNAGETIEAGAGKSGNTS
jgi:probable thiamine-phosphate pyrophosphorylase